MTGHMLGKEFVGSNWMGSATKATVHVFTGVYVIV